MQQNILDLHDKISFSLAHSLKIGKINEQETLSYMIFFDSLWEDENLIKSSIITVWKTDSIFEELIIEIEGDNKELVDTNKANLILQQIQTNTF